MNNNVAAICGIFMFVSMLAELRQCCRFYKKCENGCPEVEYLFHWSEGLRIKDDGDLQATERCIPSYLLSEL